MLIPIVVICGIVVFLVAFSLRKGTRLISVPAQPTMDDVKRLARAGQKIAAIKCYRKIHDVGLAEAKNAVEEIPMAD